MPLVRRECETVHDAVGVMDHGGFAKFLLDGPQAADVVTRIFCGTPTGIGRVRLSYMLTPQGKIWSEATIARLSETRFCSAARLWPWIAILTGSLTIWAMQRPH